MGRCGSHFQEFEGPSCMKRGGFAYVASKDRPRTRFVLDMKNFLTLSAVQYENILSCAVVGSPALEGFKQRLGGPLSAMI